MSETERGIQIDSLLKAVPYVVESFVILDDKDDMAMHRQRLVRVDSEIGFDMKGAQRAIEILEVPWRGKGSE